MPCVHLSSQWIGSNCCLLFLSRYQIITVQEKQWQAEVQTTKQPGDHEDSGLPVVIPDIVPEIDNDVGVIKPWYRDSRFGTRFWTRYQGTVYPDILTPDIEPDFEPDIGVLKSQYRVTPILSRPILNPILNPMLGMWYPTLCLWILIHDIGSHPISGSISGLMWHDIGLYPTFGFQISGCTRYQVSRYRVVPDIGLPDIGFPDIGLYPLSGIKNQISGNLQYRVTRYRVKPRYQVCQESRWTWAGFEPGTYV